MYKYLVTQQLIKDIFCILYVEVCFNFHSRICHSDKGVKLLSFSFNINACKSVYQC